MKTVVGLFENASEAEATIAELVELGFARADIRVVTKDDETRDLEKQLTAVGVPATLANRYVEGLRQGNALETVRVQDNDVNRALEVMNRYAFNGANAKTGARKTDTAGAARHAGTVNNEEVVSVIAEELQIGKREVAGKSVKVSTQVRSVPVEGEVNLREETVHVERRPVNRPVEAGDQAFQDRTIEMTETSEEAVVAKRARVIEEIVLTKDVAQRTKTIKDTVRRTEVNVEDDTAVENATTAQRFDVESFRTDWQQKHQARGFTYDQYKPAYRFGHDIRTQGHFGGSNWNEVEPNAKSTWEQKNPGTWEHFKDAVRHAWEKATG